MGGPLEGQRNPKKEEAKGRGGSQPQKKKKKMENMKYLSVLVTCCV